MADLRLRTFTAPAANGKKRRSTRVFQPVPVSIYARNKLGSDVKESTTAMTVNCHGCLYSSRHEYQSGSWVTLEIPDPQEFQRPQTVRAQVRYVRLPQSPRELYQVGVELEAPGNIWGIKSPPEDWLRFPAPVAKLSVAPPEVEEEKPAAEPAASGQKPVPQPAANGQKAVPQPAAEGQKATPQPVTNEQKPVPQPAAEGQKAAPQLSANGQKQVPQPAADAQKAVPQPAANGQKAAPQPVTNGQKPASAESRQDAAKPVRVVVSPDQLLRALEAKLQQSAEKAAAAAVAAQVNAAVNQAAKAIDNFVQASIRRADDQCAQYRDKLLASTHEAVMTRLQADLSEADAHLRSQLEGCVARAKEAAERLDRSAADVQPALAGAQDFLGKATREFQEQLSATLREAAARAASEFDRAAAGLAEQRLARLSEQAEDAGKQAASRLESKADEVRLSVDTATGTALAEFHVMARNELERAVDEARQSVVSSLSTFAAETREDWDSRRRTCQTEMEHAVEEARRKAESSLLALAAETRQDWDARLRACQTELAEAGQREMAEFRRQMGNVLNTSMVAAVSAVSEHSRALLASLAQGSEDTAADQPSQERESGHAAD